MTSLKDQLSLLQRKHVTTSLTDAKHRLSFLYDAKQAAEIEGDLLYSMACDGVNELVIKDPRFGNFTDSKLFEQAAMSFNRLMVTSKVNEELDVLIKELLLLLSPYFLFSAAHKVIEWLIFKFRANEFNTTELLACAFPYYNHNFFVRIVQVCDLESEPHKSRWEWLSPVKTNGTPLSDNAIVARVNRDQSFLKFVCQCALDAVKISDYSETSRDQAHLYICFFLKSLVSALSAGMDPNKRPAFMNILIPALMMMLRSKSQELRNSSYIVISLMASKFIMLQYLPVQKLIAKMLSPYKDATVARLSSECLMTFQVICKYAAVDQFNNKTIDILAENYASLSTASTYHGDFVSILFKSCIPRLSTIKDEDEPIFKMLQSAVPVDILPPDAATVVIRELLNVTNDTHEPECPLFKILERLARRFPAQFDGEIGRMYTEDKRKMVPMITRISRCQFARKHEPISEETSTFLSVNHADAGMRLIGMEKLREFDNLSDKENHEFVQDALLNRISYDDNEEVICKTVELFVHFYRDLDTTIRIKFVKVLADKNMIESLQKVARIFADDGMVDKWTRIKHLLPIFLCPKIATVKPNEQRRLLKCIGLEDNGSQDIDKKSQDNINGFIGTLSQQMQKSEDEQRHMLEVFLAGNSKLSVLLCILCLLESMTKQYSFGVFLTFMNLVRRLDAMTSRTRNLKRGVANTSNWKKRSYRWLIDSASDDKVPTNELVTVIMSATIPVLPKSSEYIGTDDPCMLILEFLSTHVQTEYFALLAQFFKEYLLKNDVVDYEALSLMLNMYLVDQSKLAVANLRLLHMLQLAIFRQSPPRTFITQVIPALLCNLTNPNMALRRQTLHMLEKLKDLLICENDEADSLTDLLGDIGKMSAEVQSDPNHLSCMIGKKLSRERMGVLIGYVKQCNHIVHLFNTCKNPQLLRKLVAAIGMDDVPTLDNDKFSSLMLHLPTAVQSDSKLSSQVVKQIVIHAIRRRYMDSDWSTSNFWSRLSADDTIQVMDSLFSGADISGFPSTFLTIELIETYWKFRDFNSYRKQFVGSMEACCKLLNERNCKVQCSKGFLENILRLMEYLNVDHLELTVDGINDEFVLQLTLNMIQSGLSKSQTREVDNKICIKVMHMMKTRKLSLVCQKNCLMVLALLVSRESKYVEELIAAVKQATGYLCDAEFVAGIIEYMQVDDVEDVDMDDAAVVESTCLAVHRLYDVIVANCMASGNTAQRENRLTLTVKALPKTLAWRLPVSCLQDDLVKNSLQQDYLMTTLMDSLWSNGFEKVLEALQLLMNVDQSKHLKLSQQISSAHFERILDFILLTVDHPSFRNKLQEVRIGSESSDSAVRETVKCIILACSVMPDNGTICLIVQQVVAHIHPSTMASLISEYVGDGNSACLKILTVQLLDNLDVRSISDDKSKVRAYLDLVSPMVTVFKDNNNATLTRNAGYVLMELIMLMKSSMKNHLETLLEACAYILTRKQDDLPRVHMALRCVDICISKMKMGLVPYLNKLTASFIQFGNNASSQTNKKNLLSHLHCFATLFTTFEGLLSPFAESLVDLLVHLNSIDHPSSEIAPAISDLESAMGRRLPLRLLLPHICRPFEQCTLPITQEDIVMRLRLMDLSIDNATSEEVNLSFLTIRSAVMAVLNAHMMEREASTKTTEKNNKVDESVVDLVKTVVMKISEDMFLPFFTSFKDWALGNTCNQIQANRAIMLFRICTCLSDCLKNLFTGYSSEILNSLPLVWEWCEGQEDTESVLTQSLIALHSMLLHDQQNHINTTRYIQIGKPLLEMVSKQSQNKDICVIHVCPCLGQLARANGSPDQWRSTINGIRDVISKSSKRSKRILSIHCLLEMATAIGGEFRMILPEIVPIISELMEDRSEKVVSLAHDSVAKIEGIIGESLQSNFAT